MATLKKCKKCGSLPMLYQPSRYDKEYQSMRMNAILTDYEPEPYYRCEMCLVLADKAKKQRMIDDWNKKQK